MKTLFVAIVVGLSTCSRAGILAGPITNPGNGNVYYLLSQNTWSNAEAEAVSLGGHLATIRNEDENRWVFSTFASYGGALWIGLTDRQKVFQFTWTSGEPVSYINWGGGQPDNGNGIEFYTHILPRGHYAAGQWNDYANAETVLAEQFPLYGVAEILPKTSVRLSPPLTSNTGGYTVDSRVETAGGTNYYTWAVYNQDQIWGLDGFTIEVPLETRVLARTAPAPYANPDGTAYWIMEERHEPQVDAHDGRENIPAPRPGMKLLVWWGRESPSVYPPGTTVTFSVATDASIGPGAVSSSAATYTPQNDPHYYLRWHGQVLGPSIAVTDVSPTSLTGAGPKMVLPVVRSVLATNLEESAGTEKANLARPLPVLSVTTHIGLTVEGEIGLHYGIQYNTDLANPNGWRGLANVILTTPKQVWYDPEPASSPQRYYRILPGPISIP